jgi:hypothetical protein
VCMPPFISSPPLQPPANFHIFNRDILKNKNNTNNNNEMLGS